MSDYDFAVIGGGSAGYAAARTAAEKGLKTVVIEGGRDVGGLCILRGCMPSKTLIESANRYLTLRHAGEFGLSAEKIGFDAGAIIARKRRLIGEFADYRREQLETGNFTFIRGRAVFENPETLRISLREGGETRLTARYFLVATGSAVNVPSVPGLQEAGALTSDDVLEMTHLPDSIIVLGAGPVALEMAHYFAGLGRKVTVIQRNTQVLTGMDRDVADAVEEALKRKGMKIHTGTHLLRVGREGGRWNAVFEQDGKEITVTADAMLNALGRKPYTEGLGLDRAGVALDGTRIQANSHLQTSAPNIFAAGDCTGPHEIVHIAVEQGEMAARNAARLAHGETTLESMDYRLKLFAVFTEPQVGTAGLTEEEARKAGLDAVAAKYPFNDHGKSLVMNETDGFVKLVADRKSGEILGGAVVGPHASDLIHEVVVAMRFHATAAQFAAIPHYHPTLSEIWTYPAAELADPS